MKRFFFDLANQAQVQYDFRGRNFTKPEEARELAELIALDLECTDGGNWAGAEVQVRNLRGDCSGAPKFSIIGMRCYH